MSMFMLGFEISGNSKNPCIVLFVESWTLDTPFKFWVGCIGVAVLGFAIEGMEHLMTKYLSEMKLVFQFVNYVQMIQLFHA